MELCELRVFLTVAAERSFSRAAAKLYRTQPAVSQAIRRLEDQLGERLFDRTTKNATLTEAGAVLFREGTRLLRLAEETKAAVRRQSERGRAILRIAGSEIAAHVVLPTIAEFLRQHDGVSVDFHRMEETQVVAEVTAGTFDVGVVAQDRIPVQLQHVRMPLRASGFSVVVQRGHRLAGRDGVGVSVLQAERVIVTTEPEVTARLNAVFSNASVEPASMMGMPGIDSVIRAVEMGLGVGVVPSSIASSLHTQQALAAVSLASTSFLSSLTLIYRGNEAPTSNAAQFIELVRRAHQPATTHGEIINVRRTSARI